MMRLFDLFWSALGLGILSPLFLMVAVAIKFGDRGPVFFKQERVGLNGQTFRILKFRTMATRSEGSGLSITVGHDARITPVGRWLRKWKVDELPQLINVFLGEMSLVGPRPEVPRYVAMYNREQAGVLLLRPGITDAASITYRHENDILQRAKDPETFYIQNIMPNKIRINLQYAAHATVWTNFKIILATLGLLPPPERVRQAGDLRAFDRVSLEASVQLLVGVLPPVEVQSLNISIGGILLQPSRGVLVGNSCKLNIFHEPPESDNYLVEGVVIRADDQGLAIQFPQLLVHEIPRPFDNQAEG
jgi:lipopolysaccharide/colanic/teichoic acid biosynthesis glycosyltransferase